MASMGDTRTEQGQELGDPSGVCGPSRGRDQIAVGERRVNRDVGVGAARDFHFHAASRVGRTGAALEDTIAMQTMLATVLQSGKR